MEERARIRINLAQRELEIEGPRTFLESYGERLERLLALLETAPPTGSAPGSGPAAAIEDPLESFGAFIQHLPASATDVDRMLAAGYWVQRRSGDDTFATAEASKRLVEHGFKIGNPSQCVKQAQLAKKVFVHQRGRYRVSQQGRTYLRQIMGPVIEA
ncbi:MAG: hypothetical protein NZ555_03965 [Geminicoccaceae bacterium]|nr:hypothetical protein [Geminicoccaceae bacterium]MCX8099920.1 hypothetical protein [Geminicoccaceae bacterium]MDW8370058.1 hypothetical protein [Geminicoccaceae bacterium]